MRASTLAVLASTLLVKEVFAGRYDARKRDLYVVSDVVVVTEEVTVTAQGMNGPYKTGLPFAVGTVTIEGTPILIPESTSNTPVPTIASTSEAAVFTQSAPVTASMSPIPEPTTTEAPFVPTTTKVPVQQPTTLATVVSSAAPVSSSTSSSSKRGLPYNDASLLSAFTGSKAISWVYNWGSFTPSIPSQFEFVPLLWGSSSTFTSGWNSAATKAIAAGSTHLMSFNEPDLGSQANLSPSDAAAGFKTHMEPFAGKAKLGSPAVTNGGGSAMGLGWLASFLSDCSSCTIDFVPIHWYNGGDAAAFMTYIDKAYTASGGRPLWITEFQAPGATAAEQIAFLETVIPQLDASSKVERYAYFYAADGSLLSSGSSLSRLGQTYASAA